MSNTLRTIDTITDDIVFCPNCYGYTQLAVTDTSTGQLIKCLECGHSWQEENS